MGLLQNITRRNAEPLHYIGAGGSGSPVVVAAAQCVDRQMRNLSEMNMNQFVSFADMDQKGGVPYGYGPPSQWVMPIKDGGLSAFTSVEGSGDITSAGMAGGKACGVNLLGIGRVSPASVLRAEAWMRSDAPRILGTGEIDSDLKGIAKIRSDLVGQGDLTNADMRILAWCLAIVDGAGTISAADARAIAALLSDLSGQGEVSYASLGLLTKLNASLAGSGTIPTVTLESLANMVSSLQGAGSLTASIGSLAWCLATIISSGVVSGGLRGESFLEADISSQGGTLTAVQCAAAVWSSLAAAFNVPGTMGNKMNSAASAGDPWTTDLPGPYIGDQAGKIVGDLLAKEASVGDVESKVDTVDGIVDAIKLKTDKLAFTGADVKATLDGETVNLNPITQALLQFIKDIEGGRWRIIGNQMIFYAENNTTEIARFNLFDSSGVPTMTNVFERKRV